MRRTLSVLVVTAVVWVAGFAPAVVVNAAGARDNSGRALATRAGTTDPTGPGSSRGSTLLARAEAVLDQRRSTLQAVRATSSSRRAGADVALAQRDWETARLAVDALSEVAAQRDLARPGAPATPSADQRVLLRATETTLAGDASVSPRARAAVSFALAQLGDAYLWGGNGPDRWDCSGLVQAAYRQAGVALPRVADDQFWAGTPVPRAQLRAGDLVFLAWDPTDPRTIHHVGIYLGGGFWVHAPRTGDVVRIAAVPERGYAGAVRIAG